jgi:hypothetical protein
MVAYEAPASTQTKYRSAARKVRDDPPQGPVAAAAVVSAAVSVVQDWRNNPLLFPGRLRRSMQVLHATPKPEPHPLGEEEGGEDAEEFDYYPHVPRKRYKMYDSSLPDSQPSLTRNKKKMSSRMLPPMMPSVSVVPSSVPFNPLEEPSPLGLTLRKTPSLLNLITLQLAQSTSSAPASDALSCESLDQEGLWKSGGRVEKCLLVPAAGSVAAHDKLKASNFPASTLKIGTWEVRKTSELGL